MNFIDFHCDTISKLMEAKERPELKKNSLSVDVKRLKKGGSIAQFFALFLDIKKRQKPKEYCLSMLNKFCIELSKNEKDIKLSTNYDSVIKNKSEGKISAFLTIEEGAVLEGSLCNLRNFYRLGVRLITLTWNYPNEIGYPNYEGKYIDKGLTEFGYELIEEMDRLHMLIDVSHLSDAGFYDVIRLSKGPIVASHSNARKITNHFRNLTDNMIKELSVKGGVMGINFYNKFLGENEISKIEDMITHIKYIYNVGGIEVIALGSDFDGINCEVEIKDIGEMDKLASALVKSGFSEDDVEKIFYKNAIRVIKYL